MPTHAEHRTGRPLCRVWALLSVLLWTGVGLPAAVQDESPAEPVRAVPGLDAAAPEIEASTALPGSGQDRPDLEARPTVGDRPAGDEPAAQVPGSGQPVEFWPDLGGAALHWFALVVILVIGFHARPLISGRNLSVAILALSCLVFPLRGELAAEWGLGGFVRTAAWWAVLLLTVAAVYWLIRGLALVFRGPSSSVLANVSGSALVVLLAAGLAIGVQRIATAPLSNGARDALVGGVYTAETGRLPYGQIGQHETRAPLLYLLYAGCVRLVDAEIEEPDGSTLPLNWSNREMWLDRIGDSQLGLGPVRLASGLLFVLMLLGLFNIGRSLQSRELGAAMIVLFCVFPGATECLAHPELMLPAVLLTWAMAFLFLPGAGPLLATLTLVVAGTASPWAWLGLVPLLAFFLRQSLLAAFGSVLGLAGGIAAVGYGILVLTLPAWPQAERAYAAAGIAPTKVAVALDDEGVLRTMLSTAEVPPRNALSAPLWRWLLCEDDVLVTPAQRPELQGYYEAWAGRQEWHCRLRMAARTLLEATWLAPDPDAATAGYTARSSWEFLREAGVWSAEREQTLRRIAKLMLGLIVAGLSLAIFIGRPVHPGVLIGALLVVAAGVLLVSTTGAASNWVWLLPVILAGEGLVKPNGDAARGSPRRGAGHPYLGQEPRITVER